jgi:hypothetical protein
MRTSRHDTSVRRYAIESSGVVVGDPVQGYGGVLTGVPVVRAESASAPTGLTRAEATLLEELRQLGETDARALSRRTGFKDTVLSLALERLRQLEYLSTVRRKGSILYRAKVPKR